MEGGVERPGTRKPIKGFRDLEVFQRSLGLLKPVHDLVLAFPEHERFDLANQMRRASKSIPTNIAEGYARRHSAKVFRQHLEVALGSANEMEAHFEVACALGYVTGEQRDHFVEEFAIVARQLRRLIANWRTIPPLYPPPSTLHPPEENGQ